MNMKVRRMTKEQGEQVCISRFPNLHRTGSVRGMKRLYYGNDAMLVRCGNFVYNVTSSPEIYHHANWK